MIEITYSNINKISVYKVENKFGIFTENYDNPIVLSSTTVKDKLKTIWTEINMRCIASDEKEIIFTSQDSINELLECLKGASSETNLLLTKRDIDIFTTLINKEISFSIFVELKNRKNQSEFGLLIIGFNSDKSVSLKFEFVDDKYALKNQALIKFEKANWESQNPEFPLFNIEIANNEFEMDLDIQRYSFTYNELYEIMEEGYLNLTEQPGNNLAFDNAATNNSVDSMLSDEFVNSTQSYVSPPPIEKPIEKSIETANDDSNKKEKIENIQLLTESSLMFNYADNELFDLLTIYQLSEPNKDKRLPFVSLSYKEQDEDGKFHDKKSFFRKLIIFIDEEFDVSKVNLNLHKNVTNDDIQLCLDRLSSLVHPSLNSGKKNSDMQVYFHCRNDQMISVKYSLIERKVTYDGYISKVDFITNLRYNLKSNIVADAADEIKTKNTAKIPSQLLSNPSNLFSAIPDGKARIKQKNAPNLNASEQLSDRVEIVSPSFVRKTNKTVPRVIIPNLLSIDPELKQYHQSTGLESVDLKIYNVNDKNHFYFGLGVKPIFVQLPKGWSQDSYDQNYPQNLISLIKNSFSEIIRKLISYLYENKQALKFMVECSEQDFRVVIFTLDKTAQNYCVKISNQYSTFEDCKNEVLINLKEQNARFVDRDSRGLSIVDSFISYFISKDSVNSYNGTTVEFPLKKQSIKEDANNFNMVNNDVPSLKKPSYPIETNTNTQMNLSQQTSSLMDRHPQAKKGNTVTSVIKEIPAIYNSASVASSKNNTDQSRKLKNNERKPKGKRTADEMQQKMEESDFKKPIIQSNKLRKTLKVTEHTLSSSFSGNSGKGLQHIKIANFIEVPFVQYVSPCNLASKDPKLTTESQVIINKKNPKMNLL